MSHIRFHIHINAPVNPVILSTQGGGSPPVRRSREVDGLYALLRVLRAVQTSDFVLEQGIWDTEEAARRSMEDGGLHRKETLLNISEQRYDTTRQGFSECTVCCETFEKPDTQVSVLACGHTFHPRCIREWGHYNAVCPMCKHPIPVL
jgi:hypothetical protein